MIVDYEPLIEKAKAEVERLRDLDKEQRKHATPRIAADDCGLRCCEHCRRFKLRLATMGTCFYPGVLRRPYRRGFSRTFTHYVCDAWGAAA